MSKRQLREIPFAEIEQVWKLGSYFFGERFYPAVRHDGELYIIRVVTSETRSTNGRGVIEIKVGCDDFRCGLDGEVLRAPHGYAKDYKPGRITGLAEAVTRYSAPDLNTIRMER